MSTDQAGLPSARRTDRAVAAAVAVARAHGLRVETPVVLAAANAVRVHLAPAPVVARIPTLTATIRSPIEPWLTREMDVAAFVATQSGLAVPPSPELPRGPHLHDGHWVTFWRYAEPAEGRVLPPGVVGKLLSDLHSVLRGYPGPLPLLAGPRADIPRCLEILSAVDAPIADSDLRLLRRVWSRLEPRIRAEALGPLQPLHGDAHVGNLIGTRGGWLWNDFEDTCLGPVGWDLVGLDAADRGATAPDPSALDLYSELRLLHEIVWTHAVGAELPSWLTHGQGLLLRLREEEARRPAARLLRAGRRALGPLAPLVRRALDPWLGASEIRRTPARSAAPAADEPAAAATPPPSAASLPEWEYVPEGWARRVPGWDVPAIARAYRAKWPDFLAAVEGSGPLGVAHEVPEGARVGRADRNAQHGLLVFAYALARAARGIARPSILDWGGGPGHYAVLARALFPDLPFEYTSLDLPSVVEVGRELLPMHRFESDIAALGAPRDLVVASGSLHYAEDWRAEVGRLVAATGRYLLISRLGVLDREPPFVFLQRAYAYGYETEYLGWVLNREELLGEIEARGLRLVREFRLPEEGQIPGAPAIFGERAYLFARPPHGEPVDLSDLPVPKDPGADLPEAAAMTTRPAGTGEWEHVPEGWDRVVTGWDVPSVARACRLKWPGFLEAVQGNGPLGVVHEVPLGRPVRRDDTGAEHALLIFAYALALAAQSTDRPSILDWGGGPGHFAVLARALFPDLEFDYTSRDLPGLVALGREVLPRCDFSSDDTPLDRRHDLVVASGSLQYSRDWRQVLGGLARATGRRLLLTRLDDVEDGPAFVAVQRAQEYGYGSEYLGWIFNREEILAEARALGLVLTREFLLPGTGQIPGAPRPHVGRAYLFTRWSEGAGEATR